MVGCYRGCVVVRSCVDGARGFKDGGIRGEGFEGNYLGGRVWGGERWIVIVLKAL